MNKVIAAMVCLFLLASCDDGKTENNKKAEKKDNVPCAQKDGAPAILRSEITKVTPQDSLLAIEFVSRECTATDVIRNEGSELIIKIAKNLNLDDFIYIYEHSVNAPSAVRRLVVENVAELNGASQEKTNGDDSYHLGDLQSSSIEISNIPVSLENTEKPYEQIRSIVSTEGIPLLLKIGSQYGNSAGSEWVEFWNGETGKAVTKKSMPNNSDSSGIGLSGGFYNSRLKNNSAAVLDKQNRLFGILSVAEDERLIESSSRVPLVNCMVKVVLYRIGSYINEDLMGEYGCDKSIFSNDGTIAQTLWDRVFANSGKRSNFPSPLYGLIDATRMDEADIALLERISLLDGFDVNIIAKAINGPVMIDSNPVLTKDTYVEKKRVLEVKKSAYHKITDALKLPDNKEALAALEQARELESKINSLLSVVDQTDADPDVLEYSRMNAFLIRQLDEKKIRTRAGQFSYAYEAISANGKSAIIVSNSPVFNSSDYEQLATKAVDQIQLATEGMQKETKSIAVPVVMAVSQEEFRENIERTKLIQQKSQQLRDAMREYHFQTQSFEISFAKESSSDVAIDYEPPSVENYERCKKESEQFRREQWGEFTPHDKTAVDINCVKYTKQQLCFLDKVAADKKKSGNSFINRAEIGGFEEACGL